MWMTIEKFSFSLFFSLLTKELKRPRKRLTELLIKSATNADQKDINRWKAANREWLLKFHRSPKEIIAGGDKVSVAGIKFTVNTLKVCILFKSGIEVKV